VAGAQVTRVTFVVAGAKLSGEGWVLDEATDGRGARLLLGLAWGIGLNFLLYRLYIFVASFVGTYDGPWFVAVAAYFGALVALSFSTEILPGRWLVLGGVDVLGRGYWWIRMAWATGTAVALAWLGWVLIL
jgi:hypothetical protein